MSSKGDEKGSYHFATDALTADVASSTWMVGSLGRAWKRWRGKIPNLVNVLKHHLQIDGRMIQNFGDTVCLSIYLSMFMSGCHPDCQNPCDTQPSTSRSSTPHPII